MEPWTKTDLEGYRYSVLNPIRMLPIDPIFLSKVWINKNLILAAGIGRIPTKIESHLLQKLVTLLALRGILWNAGS